MFQTFKVLWRCFKWYCLGKDSIDATDIVSINEGNWPMTNNPHWPDPSPDDLKDPEFEAIWQVIKSWDVNVPTVYNGYCGCTGNHAKAILNSIHRMREKDAIDDAVNSVASGL